MTYQNYTWTAFTEHDLLTSGSGGHSIGIGSTFVMQSAPTVTLTARDNDAHLSGDYNDDATDSGQRAFVDGHEIAHKDMYVEKLLTLQGSDGKTYTLAEIEIEDYNAAGTGDDFFSFVGEVPPAGVTLTVTACHNSSGVAYADLSATPPAAPTDGGGAETCVITFNDLARGEVIGDQYADLGVHISAQRPNESFGSSPNDAMVFDTDNPTGGDHDLAYDGRGNALIISEDNDSGDPDDNAGGGWIKFDFDNPTDLVSLVVLDAEEGGRIYTRGPDGGDWDTVDIPGGTDNGAQTVAIGQDGVAEMYVYLRGSGAIDDLTFLKDAPAPAEGSVSGRVFCDMNTVGIEDENDPGAEGVTVVLYTLGANREGVVVGETTTDANGEYHFEGLDAGDYFVRFVDPVHRNFTAQDVGDDDAIDSDANASGYVPLFHLGEGEHKTDVDAGVVPANGWIKGRLFDDADCDDTELDSVNGGYNEGVAGATIQLVDLDGNIVATTTTDAHGAYMFDVPPGSYQVQFPDVDGTSFVAQNVGAEHADSDADATGLTEVIHLGERQTISDIDAGVKDAGGSVSGRVFCDMNTVGIEDAADPGAEGVTVVLYTLGANREGVVVAETTTDANGEYHFEGLDAGDYFIRFVDPVHRNFTAQDVGDDDAIDSDANASGYVSLFHLGDGEHKTDVDAGVVPANGWIKGRLFDDADCDDTEFDSVNGGYNEGVAGATIQLVDLDGNVVATTTTDAHGAYMFDVPPGSYQVQFPDVDGASFVAQNVGAEHADSDADATGLTEVIHLGERQTISDIDAGVKDDDPGTACLYGRYFRDVNRDGLDNDGANNAVSGIVVELLDADGNPTGDTTTTDADGNYSFVNLDGGTYGVKFTDEKTGLALTEANVGDDDRIDSDAEAINATMSQIMGIEVPAGGASRDNDAGVVARMCDDPDAVKIDFEQFETGATPTELDDCVTVTVIRADAKGEEPGLGMVFDADNPTGGDRDLADNGQGNVLIISEDGDRTDPDDNARGGSFTFDFKAPASVFDITVIDTEEGGSIELFDVDGNLIKTVVIPNLADAEVAQLLLEAEGVSQMVVTLNGSGAIDDICYVKPDIAASLGGTYFMDVNDNSVQDDEDMAVTGAIVQLFQNGTLVARTTTDANGDYLFEDLAPGDGYFVRFIDTGEGKTFVDANVGDDDTIDSDVEQVVSAGNGNTALISLAPGEDKRNVDAGIEDPGNAAITGRVFMDSDKDNQDDGDAAGDMGIAGVPVDLLDAAGNVIDSTVTGADGSYAFTGLDAGTYAVDFPTEVDGKLLVEPNVGDDATDSDATLPDGTTGPITVGIGETSENNDAGVADPGTASLGNLVFFDANGNGVFDVGDDRVADVTVELLDADGAVLETTTTNATGNYVFDGLDAGVYSVRFTAPDGTLFTTPSTAAADAVDNDSDAAADTGETGPITLEIGEAERDVDAGLVAEDTGDAAITGRVFMDSDKDNQDDGDAAGDMGIAGVPVDLLDAAGNVIDSTVTGADGSYAFTGLDAGTYAVDFPTEVDGKLLVEPNVGDDATDSDATLPDGTTGPITVGIGETSENNDAGVADPGTASLGNLVFFDTNGNGVFDAGDDRVADVTVELLDADGAVLETTTTNATGNYVFDGLDAGVYSVRFTAPDGTLFTTPSTAAADAVDNDSDAAADTGETGPITLEIGEAERDVDAGLVAEDTGDAAITGRVFMDSDKDNQDDGDAAGDMGIAGVPVDLLDAAGNVIDSTVTGADGSYAFTGLDAGTYAVDFPTEVDGKLLVEPNVGDDATDSDATLPDGTTGPITVGIGETSENNDAGVADPGTASLGNLVFFDTNGNGVFDAGDDRVADVTVELLDADGAVLETTTTNATGNYVFDGLDAGVYSVRFTAPDGTLFTTPSTAAADAVDNDSDAAADTGETGPITLEIGEAERDVDAGLVAEDTGDAAITGRVFMDSDKDNQDDGDAAGDMGIAGVPVDLLDAAGNVIDSTVTGADGSYAFTGLDAGTYAVDFPTEVDGKLLVEPNVGDDATDSDATLPDGTTGPITVGIGETSENNDAGVADPGTASLGNLVFFDANGNGVFDVGDDRVADVTVELLDADGAVLETTTTNATGNYVFDGLDAGVYSVRFTAPDGTLFTTPSTAAADAVDNDSDAATDTGETGPVTLEIGEAERDVDAGLVAEDTGDAAITGRVFMDSDKDNQDDGDAAGDMGIAGVPVDLLDAAGNVIDSTVTGADGSYAFTGLDAGTYAVDFPTEVDGKLLVEPNVGDDATDSDATLPDGTTGPITVGIGETSENNDAGVADPGTASLGNLVFFDANGNGVFDVGDDRVADVTVELLDADGAVLETTTTNATGNYVFDGLDAGVYSVRFTAPDGTLFTTPSTAAADAVDNDSDAATDTGETGPVTLEIGEAERDVDAGLVAEDTGDAAITGRVFMDSDKDNQDDGDAAGDMGIAGVPVDLLDAAGNVIDSTVTGADGSYAFTGLDAGTYAVDFPTEVDGKLLVEPNVGDDATDSDATLPDGTTGPITVGIGETSENNDAGVADPGTASLGNLVFFDANGNGVFDVGDDRVADVTVELLDADGAVLETTTTNATGNYVFDGLDAGVYSVRFTAPDGTLFTTPSTAAADAVDNDSDAAADTGETGPITLEIGEAERDVDAGLVAEDTGDAAITGRVFMDSDKDNQDDGDAAGDMGIAGVPVDLLDAAGNVIDSTVTGADGSYAFTGLDAGTYAVDFPTEVDGKLLVEPNVGDDATDSDATLPDGTTGPITVGIGETSENNDAGVADPGTASLGNLVFFDTNGNGVFDAGDDRVADVTVELLDADGAVLETTTTNATGNYVFDGLDAGVYSVRFTAPDGTLFTTPSTAAADAVDNDSDAAADTGETGPITLEIGEAERDVDAGLVAEDTGDAAITGRVFMDSDKDNQDDGDAAGDMGIAGVPVDLLDAAGNVIDSTVTGADGSYAFTGLDAGTYAVDFPTEVDGKLLVEPNVGDDATDSDATLPDGTTGPITVGIGETSENNDAGVADPGTASLGNLVFFDTNGNGVFDAGDDRVADVTVELLDADGAVLETTTTNATGNYVFDGLDAGVYSVRFTAPDGTLFTTPSTAAADAVDNDSDAAADTGETGPITLEIGEAERDVDAGLVAEDTGDAAITGRVFMDSDKDNQDDGDAAGDMGIAGVPVDLLDAAGNVIDSTVTGADGSYAFTGLDAGTYAVDFPTEVDGKLLVEPNVGDDATDSDATLPDGTTGPITVGIGETSENNDAGVADPGTASLGNLVFFDANGNGVFDVGDDRVADVTVELLDADGAVLETTTTNATGNYVFDGLDAGVYSVRFTAPDGTLFTTPSTAAADAVDNDSDAATDTGETGPVTLEIGEAERDVDAGLVAEDTGDAAITGRVFMDSDKDNQDDGDAAGDMGIAGVPVDLLDAAGNVIDSTVTGADGSYAFTGLDAGTYAVDFPTEVDGKLLVEPNVGDDATDSDATLPDGTTGPITVGIGETSENNDAGVADPGTASLGNLVFFDANGNGVFDVGDDRVADVTVELLDADGAVLETTTTNATGNYVFDGLDAGVYSVRFTAPDGTLFTTPSTAAADAVDNDSDAATDTGETGPVTLEIGEAERDVDAGLVAEDTGDAAITGRVFMDSDKDNQDDGDAAGDMGIAGVPVDLLDAAGNVIDSTVTGADGSYAFTGLDAGTYAVDFPTEVDGKLLVEPNVGDDATDSDATLPDGTTGPITVGIGETSENNDAGVADPGTASLGNLVFFDANGNGVFDVGDDRVADVTVELLDADGAVLETTTTNATGNYVFDGLDAGVYSVRFTAPDGTLFTTPSTAAADAVDNDSDAATDTGETGPVTLEIGEAERDVDAGLVAEDTGDAAITGRVFMDSDKDNQDDGDAAGDMGIAGVPVDLLDAAGNVIDSTVTGADGSYAFTGLDAGTYAVDFPTEVDGKLLVEPNVGDDATDSDATLPDGTTGPITVGIGETSENNDAGVADPGTASLGNLVFFDANGNGVFDVGDDRVADVTVELLDADGAVLETTTTNATGNYVFDGLDAGVYSVRFTAPDGTLFTTPSTAAADAVDNDSDAATDTGETGPVTLEIGEAERDVDAGLVAEDTGDAAITGRVFMDSDKDNQDDGDAAGDMGIAGVPVDLLDAAGNVIDSTVTGADGSYAFTGLDAGTYAVDFPTEVDGKLLVEPNVGDDATDSDATLPDGTTGPITVGIGETSENNDAGVADPGTASLGNLVFFDANGNGVFDVGDDRVADVTVELLDADGAVLETTTTNATGNYVFDGLDAGVYSVRFTAPDGTLFTTPSTAAADAVDNDSDAAADTGETGPITLEIGEAERDVDAGLVAEDTGDAAITGRVFMDSDKDNQDDGDAAGDMGIAGVPVDLLDAAGNVIDSTVTGADGSYAFTGLDAGTYAVDFPTEVDGKLLVEPNVGDDATDSDATLPDGTTGPITVGIGETSENNDAGVADPGTASLSGRIFVDANDNAVDNNEPGVEDVTVRLLDADGNEIATTQTDVNGAYTFTNLDEGDYVVAFPTEVDGRILVDQDAGGDDTIDSDAATDTGRTETIAIAIGDMVEDVDAGIKDPGTASLAGRFFVDADKDDLEDADEEGVSGATVQLILAGAVIATTTTNAAGEYLFEGLDAGDYQVQFENPTDLVFVADNVGGDDTIDSDGVDQTDGTALTPVYTVGIGDAVEDVDVGVVDPGTASIGDKVFHDVNKNGLLDGTDLALADVLVTLFDDAGNELAQTTTAGDGSYLFDGLDAGTYVVGFEEVDGFDFTEANAGDDTRDSDADQATGLSGPVVLDVGEFDDTVDAGQVLENLPPDALNDVGAVCVDETTIIDVLANDADTDGGTPAVATVNGEALTAGESTTLDSGATVTLNADGTLSYDSTGAVLGGVAATELLIGTEAQDSFSYTIDDGQGGTAEANVDVTVKGGLNTIETIVDSLPEAAISVQGGFQIALGYSSTIRGTGDARLDGVRVEAAYCIERTEKFIADIDVTMNVRGGVEDELGGGLFTNQVAENIDKINWLLNQDFTNPDNGQKTYTEAEIQHAIWGLTDGDSELRIPETVNGVFNASQDNIDELLQLALDNGEGFVAGEGDLVTLVFDPTDVQAGFGEADDYDQAFIVTLAYDDLMQDCIC
ncbi:SdrD B-like domain-containing protein [Yoonia sp. SS1-5]|uniref:SdrD B-like domain-containing protein n=1 Tax=Yoonia rhodophyticola TaxID=3137370 RepID=A0AAN0MEZ9_9RHOB